jgi:hypothetical protein
MVKISLKLFIIGFVLVNIATNAMASTNKKLKTLGSKFDTNIVELNDDNDIYTVYFGDDLTNNNLNIKSFSRKVSNDQVAEQEKQQKRISSRRADMFKDIATEDYQLIHSYKSVPSMVIRASGKTIRQLANSPLVQNIGLDKSGGSAHLNDAIPQTNIDLIKAIPLSGLGVEVAIIDSGLDKNHPDFSGRVASQVCFSSDCSTSIYDQNGHGTNVAGIVAGSGGIAPEGGAPQVTLHILKVLDANNNFDSATQIVSALDHILTELPNVTIVNMSLGTSQLFASTCDDYSSWTRSLADAVNQLNDRGVTLFSSSGNIGDNTAITAPACLTNVIAVAATWDNRISNYNGNCTESSPVAGEITCFSNTSDNVDIVAPGALITSTGRNSGISNYSGTSMSSALVASCAALLRQSNVTLTPLELRNALVNNASDMVSDITGRSFPHLDCWQAYSSLPVDQPPVLTRVSPQSPLISTDNTQTFSLTAEDNEDGDISSQITWWVNDVITEVTGASFTHTFTLGDYIVTAKALDSANNETTLNWDISVIAEEEIPAEIIITLPSNNSQYKNNETINFTAVATSNEFGDISANIQWLYNDNVIAQGDSFNQVFTVGSHVVIATITDNNQNETQTQITFTVDQAPVLTRVSPQSPLISTDTAHTFSLTAEDNEDGDISSQINWWINNIITEVTGAGFSHTFALGNYTVTAKALDSANNETTLNWDISVIAEEEIPPEIIINLPSNNSQYENNETINFTAVATSGEFGDISANIQWLYNSELIAQGNSFSQIFTAGSHVVIATITDSNQNETQTQVTFTVSEAVVITESSSGSGSGGAINISLWCLLLIRLSYRQFFPYIQVRCKAQI